MLNDPSEQQTQIEIAKQAKEKLEANYKTQEAKGVFNQEGTKAGPYNEVRPEKLHKTMMVQILEETNPHYNQFGPYARKRFTRGSQYKTDQYTAYDWLGRDGSVAFLLTDEEEKNLVAMGVLGYIV